jgi:hypothetical protein
MVKTCQKSIFHLREAYILAQSKITILYTIFLHFEKYRVSAQKTKGLAFGFTKKTSVHDENMPKTIFHPP